MDTKINSEQINDDLKSLYDQVDYDYDAMMDKDVNKELVHLYSELSDELDAEEVFTPEKTASKKSEPKKAKSKKVEINKKPSQTYDRPTKFSKESANKDAGKKSSGNSKLTPKTRKALLAAILVVAVGVFLVSALKLISIKKGYDDANKSYEETSDEFFIRKADAPGEHKWDFSDLYAKNPDVVGYIYSEGLLSYPIVQGSDNSYYLTHLFNHDYNSAGSIFLDCNLPNKLESRNAIVYGHNMLDGSMFSSLTNYEKQGISFYNAHKEFDIFTIENKHYVYKVLSVFTASVRSNIYVPDLNDEQFLALLDEVQALSAYPTEHGPLGVDSKIMTLSTCLDNSDDAYRQVVILVRDHEVIEDNNKSKTEAESK